MFLTELENLPEETLLNDFDLELPKESKSAAKKAAKIAAFNLLDDIDIDNVTFVTSSRKSIEDDIDILPNMDFGVGLTKGLDFYNLHKENPEWKDEPIVLATEEDLLFTYYFRDGEQNEKLRNYRKMKKEMGEYVGEGEIDDND